MSSPEPGPATAPASTFSFTKGYRRYVLALLTLVYFFSYVDRTIFWTLLPKIKTDLNLSDTSLAVLSSMTFALFYATLGVPIAKLADHFNRRNIIAISITLWSVMTVACGLTYNFITLFFTRMGVGVGEAGSSPPSHSIISDYYTGKERAGALAILATAITLGVSGGQMAGGVLGDWVGWKNTLIIVGAPGLLVGLLVMLTLREPPRGHADGMQGGETVGMFKTMGVLLKSRTFRFNALGGAMQGYVGYSLLSWASSYFERSYGLSLAEIGVKLSIVILIGGLCGVLPGGFVSDWLSRHNLRWYTRIPALGMVLSALFIGCTYFTHDADLAFILFGAGTFAINLQVSPMFTIAQGVAPLRMRASSTALLFLSINLLGMGLGPVFVGLISDALVNFGGYSQEEALRKALMPMLTVGAIIGAYFFWTAGRTIHRDFVTPHPGKKEHLAAK